MGARGLLPGRDDGHQVKGRLASSPPARAAEEPRAVGRPRRLPVRPETLPLVLLLAIGIVLRAWFMLGYRPASLGHADSEGYDRSADVDLFGSSFRSAGCPVFLRLAHLASANLSFTIALQHALGVGTAALLYASVRRVGGPRWAALLPAAVV